MNSIHSYMHAFMQHIMHIHARNANTQRSFTNTNANTQTQTQLQTKLQTQIQIHHTHISYHRFIAPFLLHCYTNWGVIVKVFVERDASSSFLKLCRHNIEYFINFIMHIDC